MREGIYDSRCDRFGYFDDGSGTVRVQIPPTGLNMPVVAQIAEAPKRTASPLNSGINKDLGCRGSTPRRGCQV